MTYRSREGVHLAEVRRRFLWPRGYDDLVRRCAGIDPGESGVVTSNSSRYSALAQLGGDFAAIVQALRLSNVGCSGLLFPPRHDYGKSESDQARILEHVKTVEPLLRRSADVEIDATAPLDVIAATLESLGRGEPVADARDQSRQR